MGETIRAAGVRAVKQMLSSNLQEVRNYIEQWNPTPFEVILKPVNSAGTCCGFICNLPLFNYFVNKKCVVGMFLFATFTSNFVCSTVLAAQYFSDFLLW